MSAIGVPLTIAILDDDPSRIQAMKESVSRQLPRCREVTFDNAPDMIEWLQKHWMEASILSLDHDLGLERVRNGELFDPGTGRDVVNYLATQTPFCPVLIHTSSGFAAAEMEIVLEGSGWQSSCVTPSIEKHRRLWSSENALMWISDEWIGKVTAALKDK